MQQWSHCLLTFAECQSVSVSDCELAANTDRQNENVLLWEFGPVLQRFTGSAPVICTMALKFNLILKCFYVVSPTLLRLLFRRCTSQGANVCLWSQKSKDGSCRLHHKRVWGSDTAWGDRTGAHRCAKNNRKFLGAQQHCKKIICLTFQWTPLPNLLNY